MIKNFDECVNRLTGAIVAGRTGLKPTVEDLQRIVTYIQEHQADIWDEIKEIARQVSKEKHSDSISYVDMMTAIRDRYRPV